MEESPESHPSPGLEIQLSAEGDRAVLRLVGELDLSTVPQLDDQLRQLESLDSTDWLIDLSGVWFMDSTGLAAIVRAQQAATSNGHRLAFRRGSSQVQRLLELMSMTDRFAFED